MNPRGALSGQPRLSRRARETQRARKSRSSTRPKIGLGLVVIPAQRFTMGTDDPASDPANGEGPPHTVSTAAFSLARYAVTNEQFARFVHATGYRTTAELTGHSRVFQPPASVASKVRGVVASQPWWAHVEGACWRAPEGPGSSVEGRKDHPVTHVSWHDAGAFCAWSGTVLPTEAQWEAAARGGIASTHYPWGNERDPAGQIRMNVFHGDFPVHNTALDGWQGTCPVGWFPPNHFGLFEMTGNVWEWVADWFSPSWYRYSPAVEPVGPKSGTKRILRGGSHLSDQNHGAHYRVDSRIGMAPQETAGDIGFRVASTAKPAP